MTLFLVYFFGALVVSFVCSLLEAVLLSMTPAHVALMGKRGFRAGHILERLKAHIHRPLAAILSVNTIANTLGATGVGAQAHHVFQSHPVAIAGASLTFSILVLSEIIPKTLGARHWRLLAGPSAYLIGALIIATYPLVLLLEVISRCIATGSSRPRVTREEMLVVAELGARHGSLHPRELRVIRQVLRLDHTAAREVMTPRAVLMALPRNRTVAEVMHDLPSLRFSRIPVFQENEDQITGIVHRLRIVDTFLAGHGDTPLHELERPVQIVPETETVSRILEKFIRHHEHLFLVLDEYGGTAGIITLEDAIETLLAAEIIDETDEAVDMQQLARQRFLERYADGADELWAPPGEGSSPGGEETPPDAAEP